MNSTAVDLNANESHGPPVSSFEVLCVTGNTLISRVGGVFALLCSLFVYRLYAEHLLRS